MSSAISNLVSSVKPGADAPVSERALLSEIDRSTRAPAFYFLVSSMLWLLIGTAFGYISSQKLHSPGFLADWEWLTFGNTRTAHLNAMIYGWSTNAAFAVSFWLMARLSRTKLRHSGILTIAAAFWNLGVTIGIFGILRGDSTSVEWLEMPGYATPLLFVAYALVGVWGVITFRFRQTGHVYVSQWYILAAFFWFPWLYSIAQIMLIAAPARGTVQSLVNWWFAHNVLGLWFTPIGLGAIYYFLPKVLGKPIHSYYLSVIGFWSLALFYNWAGVHHLIGGPVPAWVISAGVVASLMMVMPVIVVAINHHATMVGSFAQLKYSPTLRFIVFGAVNYTLTSLLGSAMALRSVSETVHFTHFTVGHAHHGMYAFFSMVMFGSIYYMMPRLVNREWPSSKLITIHFWTTAVGSMMYVIGLSVGGWIQGMNLNAVKENGEVVYTFMQVVEGTLPYLTSRTISGIVITIGHVAFAISFVWMLLQKKSVGVSQPTLFNTPPTMQVAKSS